jgi:hypothetical protein
LVRENPEWGCWRVHGELLVPGIQAAASTVTTKLGVHHGLHQPGGFHLDRFG